MYRLPSPVPTYETWSQSLAEPIAIAQHIAFLITSLPPEVSCDVRRNVERLLRRTSRGLKTARVRVPHDRRGPWRRESRNPR